MADKVSTSEQIVIDLTLSRDDDTTTRRLTFDNYDSAIIPQAKSAILNNLVPSLVGGGMSTFIQPSGWRDDDDEEDEYTCTAVRAKRVSKTETEFDLGF